MSERWCPSCLVHIVSDPRKGAICPVCDDKLARESQARVAEFWAQVVSP